MAARWIDLGYAEPIDKANVPNAKQPAAESLASPPYDPERNFTLPWQSGMTGIGYNPKQDRPQARRASTTCSTRSSRAA